MNRLRLKEVCKDIFDQAENSLVPAGGLPKLVDDYFVERIKRDELTYATIEPAEYEVLREEVRREVLPLYKEYYRIREGLLERKQRRRPALYILGTVGLLQLLELLVWKGRSLAPQILIPTLLVQGFLGFVIYAVVQYRDDFILARARRRLEHSLTGLDQRLTTEVSYEARRKLLESDILKAEAVVVTSRYETPEAFWDDYRRAREADPTTPAALEQLDRPAFAEFLKPHVDGACSAAARQRRFNHLFLQAHEVFLTRDREGYVQQHLNRYARRQP
jgi:hypothetical protein